MDTVKSLNQRIAEARGKMVVEVKPGFFMLATPGPDGKPEPYSWDLPDWAHDLNAAMALCQEAGLIVALKPGHWVDLFTDWRSYTEGTCWSKHHTGLPDASAICEAWMKWHAAQGVGDE